MAHDSERMSADDVAARINKAYERTHEGPLVVKASDIINPRGGRMTTGVMSLDSALGGGWTTKQWHEIYADESTGKTATAYLTIAANQKLDPDFYTVWVAAEEYVASYAEMCGVDNSRVYIVETSIMEEAMQQVIEFIDARACDLVVIDSLAQLVPTEEEEKDVNSVQVALQARITGKFFRKVRQSGRRSLLVEDRACTGLIINQTRVDVGGWAPHGQTAMTTPGGRAKNFNYFSRVELKRTDWLLHPTLKTVPTGRSAGKPLRVGQEVRATVHKNKNGPGGRIAVWDFYTDNCEPHTAGSIDAGKDVVLTAMSLGVLEQRGAMYSFSVGETEYKWRGREKAFDAILEDEELQEHLRGLCASSIRGVG